jgi:hypothetical protein
MWAVSFSESGCILQMKSNGRLLPLKATVSFRRFR